MGILLVLLFSVGAIVGIVRLVVDRKQQNTLIAVLLFAYVMRLLVHVTVARSGIFFSHGIGGGDSVIYQLWSTTIADYWRRHGIVFVTQEMMPEIGSTALICNLYALVNIAQGEETPFGYTGLAALVGCLTSLEVYRSSREFGASARGAMIALLLVLFSPAFVFHTSDCYKDGFVAFFTVMSFTGSMRIARSFSLPQLMLLSLWLTGLWFVRFYMVFMCSVPIAVGLIGLKSRSLIRRVLSILAVFVFVGVAFFGGLKRSSAFNQMVDTYEHSHDSNVVQYNAQGGSGVTFNDGGNPFGAIGLKLLYTVASPFPWQGGSFGLHLGKIDVFVFYFLIYRAYLSSRKLFVTDREAIVQFLSFLVPATVAYATTMANIGLILRQRMPIVFVTAILAALSWSERPAIKRVAAPVRRRAATLPVTAERAA
jgi:hypothetical protein